MSGKSRASARTVNAMNGKDWSSASIEKIVSMDRQGLVSISTPCLGKMSGSADKHARRSDVRAASEVSWDETIVQDSASNNDRNLLIEEASMLDSERDPVRGKAWVDDSARRVVGSLAENSAQQFSWTSLDENQHSASTSSTSGRDKSGGRGKHCQRGYMAFITDLSYSGAAHIPMTNATYSMLDGAANFADHAADMAIVQDQAHWSIRQAGPSKQEVMANCDVPEITAESLDLCDSLKQYPALEAIMPEMGIVLTSQNLPCLTTDVDVPPNFWRRFRRS